MRRLHFSIYDSLNPIKLMCILRAFVILETEYSHLHNQEEARYPRKCAVLKPPRMYINKLFEILSVF